jgi:hypothetical protein
MEDVLRFSSEATQNASNTSTIVYIIAVINICFLLVVIFGILEIAINTRKTRKNTEITNQLLVELLQKNNEFNN